jgi:hypothetical protein
MSYLMSEIPELAGRDIATHICDDEATSKPEATARETGQEYSDDLGIPFLETSAKSACSFYLRSTVMFLLVSFACTSAHC